jgi:hypothetical protein
MLFNISIITITFVFFFQELPLLLLKLALNSCISTPHLGLFYFLKELDLLLFLFYLLSDLLDSCVYSVNLVFDLLDQLFVHYKQVLGSDVLTLLLLLLQLFLEQAALVLHLDEAYLVVEELIVAVT